MSLVDLKLLKNNNFFAIKPKLAKDFHKYPTIFDGINAGIEKLKSHPDFSKNKIGTLKANQSLQSWLLFLCLLYRVNPDLLQT